MRESRSKLMKDADSVGRLIDRAMPVVDDGSALTRSELHRELLHIETKFLLAETKMQRWVMGGVLFVLATFGGSGVAAYTSIVSKLDSVEIAATAARDAQERLDERAKWIAHKDAADARQDAILQRLAPDYEPTAYREPPK